MINNRAYILLTRKLTGEANDSEINELNLLINENPELNQVAKEITSHWETQQGSDEEFLEATYLLHIDRMKNAGIAFNTHENSLDEVIPEPEQKSRNSRKLMLWAMPVVLILAATWFFTRSNNEPAQLTKSSSGNNLISTRNGSRSKIQLPDGSSVWLNAGSKLEYDKSFGNETRDVYLTGEAYFDVVRNPEKPFIVNTGQAKVKVLGTSFNVRCYPDDKKIETSLIHGSVEVTLNNKPEEKWILKPNHKLVLSFNSKNLGPQLKEENTENKKTVIEPDIVVKELTYIPGKTNSVETAWTFNILSFEDESFVDAAKKMSRWYDVEFVFKKKELEDLMLHGTFTIETIKEAMEALQYSFKFRYEIKDKIVTIY